MADNLGELWKKGSSAPLESDLVEGGLGVDVVHGKIYSKLNTGNIFEVGGTTEWGNIIGSIQSQSDLVAELDKKVDYIMPTLRNPTIEAASDTEGGQINFEPTYTYSNQEPWFIDVNGTTDDNTSLRLVSRDIDGTAKVVKVPKKSGTIALIDSPSFNGTVELTTNTIIKRNNDGIPYPSSITFQNYSSSQFGDHVIACNDGGFKFSIVNNSGTDAEFNLRHSSGGVHNILTTADYGDGGGINADMVDGLQAHRLIKSMGRDNLPLNQKVGTNAVYGLNGDDNLYNPGNYGKYGNMYVSVNGDIHTQFIVANGPFLWSRYYNASTSSWSDWIQYTGTNYGEIKQWSNGMDNIPDGWVLCDGNNDTPDMREEFRTYPTSNANVVKTVVYIMYTGVYE